MGCAAIPILDRRRPRAAADDALARARDADSATAGSRSWRADPDFLRGLLFALAACLEDEVEKVKGGSNDEQHEKQEPAEELSSNDGTRQGDESQGNECNKAHSDLPKRAARFASETEGNRALGGP